MNTRTAPFLFAPVPLDPLILRPEQRTGHKSEKPLGQILVDTGDLTVGDMLKASAIRAREDALFGDILITHGMVTQDGLFRGLAKQYGCEVADLATFPPDARLVDDLGVDVCLRHGVVPWKRIGAVSVFVTCRPDLFAAFKQSTGAAFGPILMAIAPENEVQAALLKIRKPALARRAEIRVPPRESCRNWQAGIMARYVVAAIVVLLTGLAVAPDLTLIILCGWAILALTANTLLKIAAVFAALRRPNRGPVFRSCRPTKPMMQLPVVSIMVPLFREGDILVNLVRRLNRLSYPRELLDICLILEEDDVLTQSALKRTELPLWMRQITVPHGTLKTKPRALNYALDFCRGSIIGVYDAEDAPDSDQIHKVVRRFHDGPKELACLQGVLDFYNPTQNWLSRCFTVEYATWFGIVLPGLARLGLAIPLGGTTVFLRRNVLEKLGGWDAHNVTEDADLGIRLARHGYRTELIDSTTFEEANCHFWPWIKQRSRWLKGYAMTWAVHMQNPAQLWRDLGAWRFWGVQLLFGGTLSQFLLAPVLWSFWALPLGLPHPLNGAVSKQTFIVLTALFLSAEILTLAIGIIATRKAGHKTLWPWVATLHIYFPLASIAGYKALWELISRPFYWDKTLHGLSRPDTQHRGKAPRHRFSRRTYQRQLSAGFRKHVKYDLSVP